MRRLASIAILLAATAARADKSPTVAEALSGTGAGVSGALVLSSFVIGTGNGDVNTPLFIAGLATSIVTPSLGQFYTGQYFTFGEALRGGAAVLAGAAILGEQKTVACDDGINKDCKTIEGVGIALLGVAAIAYIGGMAYDVMDASDAAARANERSLFTLAPLVQPHTGGLAIVGRF